MSATQKTVFHVPKEAVTHTSVDFQRFRAVFHGKNLLFHGVPKDAKRGHLAYVPAQFTEEGDEKCHNITES